MTPQSTSLPSKTGKAKSGPEWTAPMPMCPMATTCKGVSETPILKSLLPLPGLLMIAVGVLILVVPALLVWFVALASIVMGGLLLTLAIFMIKMGDTFRRIQS